MRICIQILYTKGWNDLSKITVPNAVNYCRKHGYSWNVQCIDEPYNGFEKLRYIKTIFEVDETDVVVSMDADTLITNHTIKIEDLVEDEVLYISKDYNGINCGVFIFRNIGTLVLLDILLSKRSKDGFICEQEAIKWYIENINQDGVVKLLPQNKINSYLYKSYPEISMQTHEQGNWEQGDFVLHLPGMTLEKRIEIINEYKTRIVYE